MYDRRAVILTVVVLVLTGVAIVGIVLFTDDEPERTLVEDPAFGGPTATLDAGGQELVALLERGRTGTWHAVYSGSGPGGTSEVEVEIWRSAGRVRQDSTVINEDGRATAAVFILPDQFVSCTSGNDGAWGCVEVAERVAREATDLIGSADRDFRGVTVTARDDVVDDRPVRCFSFDRDEAVAELCLTPEGVPVTIGDDELGVRLVSLDGVVEEPVFELPAEISRLEDVDDPAG